jgi:VWFA-related protein
MGRDVQPVLVGLLASLALAAGPQAAPQQEGGAEMTVQDVVPTFQVRTNLVLVPVVVRDAQGRPIENLKREDFELFDKGKAQTITKFSFEKPALEAAKAGAATRADEATALPPARYTAFLFDDLHLSPQDLARAREAAGRELPGVLRASGQAAVFTTSGHSTLGFTDERARLEETLLSVQPHPAPGLGARGCPDVSYYQADRILNGRNQDALDTATLETVNCAGLDPSGPTARAVMEQAQRMAEAAAQHALAVGENATRAALNALRGTVREVAANRGEKTIVVISPGFLTQNARADLGRIIDAAVRRNVVVNALDARGLAADDPVSDVTNQTQLANPALLSLLGRDTADLSRSAKARWMRDSATTDGETLGSLADGTGGVFFRNNNDLAAGFARTAGAPEGRYILGFSPPGGAPDGSFHPLKVTLRNVKGASVQARRGYVNADDPVEDAKREIADAVFSRETARGIPAEVSTQFFKHSATSARLSVVTRIDVRQLPFRKEAGRNRDNLTVVSAVFDEHGRYVSGIQRDIEMRLLDQTLHNEEGPPVAVKSEFDVKPGAYVVRVVVRDTEGERLTAVTTPVEIPW